MDELPEFEDSSYDLVEYSHDALKRKWARSQREIRRLRNTVSFQLGLHLTTALRRPWRLLGLPITFPLLALKLGLQRLGSEIGSNLPSTFKPVEMTTQHEVIRNFDPGIVTKAISNDGGVQEVFSRKTESGYSLLPYVPENFDTKTQQYSFTPVRGPLFDGLLGIVVVILFAFMMGYSATLAEPALNALGATVEQITVGTFKKQLLMQAVAIGVGVGIALGVTKIIYNVPLIWMLVPPYLVLMVLTFLSNEDFVNIGWDSAGVTTGPVTVPLVLAMGLGIGGQVGSIEGFGILSMASVCPILSVLIVGLFVTKRRQSKIDETAA